MHLSRIAHEPNTNNKLNTLSTIPNNQDRYSHTIHIPTHNINPKPNLNPARPFLNLPLNTPLPPRLLPNQIPHIPPTILPKIISLPPLNVNPPFTPKIIASELSRLGSLTILLAALS